MRSLFSDLDEKRLEDTFVMSIHQKGNQKGIDPPLRFRLAMEHIKSLKRMIRKAKRVEK